MQQDKADDSRTGVEMGNVSPAVPDWRESEWFKVWEACARHER